MAKTLLVLLGPTGVGKTELSLQMAEHFACPIVSADSRQIFRELKIGTAAPTEEQQKRVKHYFVGTHSVFESYSAGSYEEDALSLLNELFCSHEVLMLVGGSMMYIDAVCKGFDNIPNVSSEVRAQLNVAYAENGLDWLRAELQRLDPAHYERVDTCNYKRMLHALEVCVQTGLPYSSFCTQTVKQRPFDIVKIGLNRPRTELYDRINMRVDEMMADGLLHEAAAFFEHRHLNSLNTVGYKELFKYMDGTWTLDFAVDMIKQDSRRYAKRQLTWFRADSDIQWFNPDDFTLNMLPIN